MQWPVLVLVVVVVLAILAFLVYRLTRRTVPPPRMARSYRPTRGPVDLRDTAPRAPSRAPAPMAPPPDEYATLLTMVLGDRQKADRLIAYEQRRDPRAPRARLIANAITSMRNDQRR